MSVVIKHLKRLKGKPPECSAIIAAAGSSQRMAGEDKLFVEICGAPVLYHTLAAFQNCNLIKEIIVVARNDSFELIGELCEKYSLVKVAKIVEGGSTRLESVMNGVYAASKKSQLIAVHDGARPCVDEDVIERAVIAATKWHAAAPAVPIGSTVKRVEDRRITETVDRRDLVEIQTPQVFATEIIKAALTNAIRESIDATDDCMAVELIGFPIHITEGSSKNIKLTTQDDLFVAEAILGN